MWAERLSRLTAVDAGGPVATRLDPPMDGKFSGCIDVDMIYGAAKVDAILHYANEKSRDWRFDPAYDNHQGDQPPFSAAPLAVAGGSDGQSQSIARRCGWDVVH
jgi:phosphoserine phosphatase